jgi:hypothetical protein
MGGYERFRVVTDLPTTSKSDIHIMATRKIGRDAKTGEFITVKKAQSRPNTTTVETIKTKPKSTPKKK